MICVDGTNALQGPRVYKGYSFKWEYCPVLRKWFWGRGLEGWVKPYHEDRSINNPEKSAAFRTFFPERTGSFRGETFD